jgi:hypothetical protein
MDRGPDGTANDYGGYELPNVFDGQYTKIHPPFDLFILSCSLIPFLLLNIIFIFLLFLSHFVP